MVFSQRFHQITDFDDLLGIQAYRRLIQNNDLRITDQCLSNTHALAIAFGQIFDQTLFHVRNLNSLHDLFQLHIALFLWHLLQVCYCDQIFPYGHVHIQRRDLRQITDALFGFLRLCQDIMPVDQDLSRCGGDISGHHIHCRGLSGTVRA